MFNVVTFVKRLHEDIILWQNKFIEVIVTPDIPIIEPFK